MSVAIRAITRIQDGDDAPALGAGQDGYALTWDNASGAFVATALFTDHGALGGLLDDDHTQYLLATGARAMTGALTLTGNVATAATEISSIVVVNGANTVGKIAVESTDTSQDDGNLVFYLAFNGTLAEKLRIPRSGEVTFAATCYFKSTNCWINGDANGNTEIGGRIATAFYTALYSRNYAYFHRDGNSYIIPYSSLTNSAAVSLILGHNTSGTPAAGFGTSLSFSLESSTTENTAAARIQALWNDATHATRKADLVLTAYDTAEREGLRIRGNGSAAAIGFLGATPQARIAHVADPAGGATVDAEARSAINSILATLENFGFHATS